MNKDYVLKAFEGPRKGAGSTPEIRSVPRSITSNCLDEDEDDGVAPQAERRKLGQEITA